MSFLSHPTVLICRCPATNPAPTRERYYLVVSLLIGSRLVFFQKLEFAMPRVKRGFTKKEKKVYFVLRCLTYYWRGSRIPMHALVSKQEPISKFTQSCVRCHVAIL